MTPGRPLSSSFDPHPAPRSEGAALVWALRRLPGGAAEFQLGAAASFVPLAETMTWWDDPHRD